MYKKNMAISRLNLNNKLKDFVLWTYGKQCYHILCSVEKIKKVKIQKLLGQNERIMLLSKCAVCDKICQRPRS